MRVAEFVRFAEVGAGGMSIEDILAGYEDLEREDILAVLDFEALR